MDKPYAPACDRNREPILAVLRDHFADRRAVLEIGSGTGQHAVYFAAALPHLGWQTSDRESNLPGIRLWLDEAGLPNTPAPVVLDVNGPWPWPSTSAKRPSRRARANPAAGSAAAASANQAAGAGSPFDAVFSANTLHIMGWGEVARLFEALPSVIAADATLVVYGPFNYAGRFTSDSNAAFDARLKREDPRQGLRDFEAVDALARAIGFELVDDRAMPANNRTLVWRRRHPA